MVARYCIGVDPGLAGAVAVIDLHSQEVFLHDMPVLKIVGPKKETRVIHEGGLVEIFKRYTDGPVIAGIERVHAFPQMGVVSSFSFGTGYGVIIGIVATLGFSYQLVEPTRWKKVMMDGMGKEKEASIAKASQLFPQLATLFAWTDSRDNKIKKDGRAEALLIAEYTRRIVVPEIQGPDEDTIDLSIYKRTRQGARS